MGKDWTKASAYRPMNKRDFKHEEAIFAIIRETDRHLIQKVHDPNFGTPEQRISVLNLKAETDVLENPSAANVAALKAQRARIEWIDGIDTRLDKLLDAAFRRRDDDDGPEEVDAD
ncbi:hypothetical protein EUV02_15450 [Polymorphobacter arshaanensis]|uniref:Uncharacterized protein n=1 Tax=Glacieibacterium arshaanense TaxID=2511025 RepID=A0A4Y9EJQ8_9SPHN|nr:hypothetical protein [Polymorphobacter arshaanensis]TFU00041.1 hypothetical protein EUV02_15450 [Polymorphobacter arshaanensis]